MTDRTTPRDLFETHLTVSDIDRSKTFYGDVVGLAPALKLPERGAACFQDPDGHMLEYLAMLDEPPRPDAGIVPWSRWLGMRPPGTSGP